MKMLALLCTIILGASEHAQASRSIRVEPMRFSAFHDFKKDIYGNVTGYSDGTNILTGFQIFINLQNLSTAAQNGSIKLIEPYGEAAQPVGGYMNITTSICTNTNSNAASGVSTASSSYLKQPVKFQLAGLQGASFFAYAVFDGKFDKDGPPAGVHQVFEYFRTGLEIVIDEDRGAVSGSVTPERVLSNPVLTCDKNAAADKKVQGVYGMFLIESGLGNTIALNGGRPF